VETDANGSSWALAASCLSATRFPIDWDANRRRILIGSLDVAPTFQENQGAAQRRWPLFEMTLQHGNAPVILRGIPARKPPPRAACSICPKKFGHPATSFEPFHPDRKRRGG